MKVIAIAAVGKNGVIGKGSELPWNIPEDMKFFKDATRDHIVLMGRKTYQALGQALPKRENAVLTRDKNFSAEKVKVFSEIKEAIQFYKNESTLAAKTLFVIGGAEIYKLAVPYLDEIWLTEIDAEFDGDIFYPDYRDGKFHLNEFQAIEKRPRQDLSTPFHYLFVKYARKA